VNDDFEQRLRDIRLAPPSTDLDRRMDGLFAAAPATVSPRAGWWRVILLPAAGLAAALVLFSLRPSPPRVLPDRPVVYQVEPHGLMRELLLMPTARPAAMPNFEASVQLQENSPP
jgi:hypothetical protein